METFKDRKKQYSLKIKVITTGAKQDVISEIEGITVDVVCGPKSSTPIPPKDPVITQMADIGG